MESLYVCLFSNGHIKVGRSIETQSRIASHADRVACMGVELSDYFIAQCAGPASPCETELIDLCIEAAERRFQSEWFSGLDFLIVCGWASDCAGKLHVPSEVSSLRAYLDSLPRGGVRKFAEDVGIGQVYLTQIASGFRKQPSEKVAVRMEQVSGGRITRQELRDDWQAIWPELREAKHAA